MVHDNFVWACLFLTSYYFSLLISHPFTFLLPFFFYFFFFFFFEIWPQFSSLKSSSCFSTAFLNFLCILYLSTFRILSPRSSRKLWENMAIRALFSFVILSSCKIHGTWLFNSLILIITFIHGNSHYHSLSS